jgi:hypothetical protein
MMRTTATSNRVADVHMFWLAVLASQFFIASFTTKGQQRQLIAINSNITP